MRIISAIYPFVGPLNTQKTQKEISIFYMALELMASATMRKFFYLHILICLLLAGVTQPSFSQVLPFDFYTIEDGLPSNWINCIYQDSRGYMWIATEEGVAIFDGVAFKVYNVADGLPDNRVVSIIESRTSPGTMWIGTFGGGLCKFAGNRLSTIRMGATTNSNIVLSVCEDDAGIVWCGTYEGVFQVRNDSAYAFPAEAPKGWTPFIKQTRDRSIWIGTGIGVFAYSPVTGKTIRLLDHPTECMAAEDDGNVWICTNDGMIHLVRDRQVVASRRLPIMSNVENNYRMLCDREGTLWIGSGEGIATLDKNQFQDGEFIRYTVANGLRENIVSWFFLDRENIVWLGSWNKGIAVLADQKIHTFPVKAVFPPVNNRAVAATGPGHFFVAAQEGVWEVWKNRYGRWQQKLHRVNACKITGIPSSVQFSSDGALWLAFSDGGFCKYEVTDLHDQGSVLKCVKTLAPGIDVPAGALSATMIDDHDGLRMQGRSFPFEEDLEFSHQENFCEIQFTGISFKAPQALRFQYKLSGPSGEGQAITSQRAVTYPGLRPGKYTFEVSAMNAAGITSEGPATLTFTIVPPFWRGWWFVALALASVGAIIIGLERLRVRRLLEIEKIRSRIATDLHDDIGAGLTHIGLLSEITLREYRQRATAGEAPPAAGSAPLRQPPKAAKTAIDESIAQMGNIARELSAAMSDVVWSINPKHDSMEALLRRLTSFAQEICKAKNVELKMIVDERISRLKLHPEVRRNLLLIAKEALNNMAKYSHSKSVDVRIEGDGTFVSLAVDDFGSGFDVAKAKNGNGLLNMRSRAEKLGGACEIHSEAGKGTRVSVNVPIKNG
jgi:signal transduction histidine kinase/streptogramin lyase